MEEFGIEYQDQFLEDILSHRKAGDRSILLKVNNLIDELRKHPYTGTGKPEPLKGKRKGQWSRRITQKHRLIYEVHDDSVVVILLSAFGHYGDK